jgi:hypothetical protein
MRVRNLIVSAFVVAAVVIPAAGAAQAAPAQAGGVSAAAKAAKPVKVTKPVKVPFAVNGTVAAVDVAAGTVTIATTGGMRDLRGKTITITMSTSAKIVVDDVRATLASVQAGHRVTAVGVRAGALLTATKLGATTPLA